MNAKESKKAERTKVCRIVIDYLNEQAGRGYHSDSRGTLKLFTAEWSHKYGIDQYKGVIDYLVLKWKNDPYMSQYLRPQTLFGPEKFPEYLDEARALVAMEIRKHRLVPFKRYLPVEQANSLKLVSFKNYNPHE